MKAFDYLSLVVVFWLLQKQLGVLSQQHTVSTASIVERMDRSNVKSFVVGQKPYEIKVVFPVYPAQ